MVAFRALTRRPLTKPSPQADPRYRRVMDQLKAGASRTKTHPPAAKRATEAAAAAKEPPNARLAQGKAKQVDKIKEAPTKKPESNSFIALLRAEIEKVMPKTLGETEHFMEGGSSGQMKSGLKGNVSQQKQQATGDVAGASKQAPAPAGDAKPTSALPPDATPPAPNVAANEGMPAPKSESEVSVADSKQDTDQAMKEAEVTPQSLSNAHDKRFDAVNDARKEVVKQADAAPAKYRAAEKTTLTAAAGGAKAQAVRGAAEMIGVRRSSASKVGSRQKQQISADEKRRQQFTAKLDEIFNATKSRVDAKLEALDGEVNTMFDAGVDAALNTMKAFVEDKIFRYKLDRYLSVPLLGAAAWIRDQFLGLPDEVNQFFEQGRRVFQAAMDALILKVANRVEQRLKEAKDEVARGQAAIKAEVASMPANLRAFAQQAASNYQSQFADLEKGIEDKKNQLAQSLANKYKEAFDKANAALKEIQDANKGLVQAFVEKLGEVIKMLAEFKAKLMGLLRKGAETIKLILNDPLGFLSNLIAAVKGGISAFVANIWAHLKRGFMQWLFGALASAGIEIPSDLSLVSIFKLVMGVLGITYDRMRAKAVKLIGERNVAIIEKLVEYIRVLIQGGPKALWEKVKEDLSTLKAMVIDAIQNWLIETVVKQAVAKIVSMFNPAGAIVQAIIAIYNIVMFVIEKAQQIMTFVEAVINSVHAIATGAIGGAIAWIERSLAAAIPIVIGFLARLIGLGGISQKIREFITKVQSKVDAAIDKAIAKIVALVKKLFGKGGAKPGAKPGEEDRDTRWKKGIAEVQQYINSASEDNVMASELQAGLEPIKAKYKFTVLKLVATQNSLEVDAAMSPGTKVKVTYRKLVTDDKGNVIIPGPPGSDKVELITSKRGKERLFALVKNVKRWVYNLRNKTSGFWQPTPVKDDPNQKAAEDKARAWVEANEAGWIPFVDVQKPPHARGFDVAGVVPAAQPGGGAPRLVIGEVKSSSGKKPRYFGPGSFTAITGASAGKEDTLAGNIAQVATTPERLAQIRAAFAAGNVDIIIFLTKDAKVTDKQFGKLKRKVLADLRKYIKANFPGVDANAVVKNVIVRRQDI